MPQTAAGSADQETPEKHLEQWANIFDSFGEKAVRETLWSILCELEDSNTEHCVVEFSIQSDGYAALDITDHHDELQRQFDGE